MKIQARFYIITSLLGLILACQQATANQPNFSSTSSSSFSSIGKDFTLYTNQKLVEHRISFGESQTIVQFEDGLDSTLLAWSPDGTHLAVSGNISGTIKVIHIESGSEVLNYNYPQAFSPILDLAWSPDSRYLAVDGDVQSLNSGEVLDEIDIFDIFTGEQVKKIQHSSEIYIISWSPDGQYLSSADSGDLLLDSQGLNSKLRIFGSATGEEILQVSHDQFILDARWSPDGRYIATASVDKTARIVDVSRRSEIFNLLHTRRVEGVAWSPDGQYLATRSQGGSQILNVVTGEPFIDINEQVQELTWSPDGRYIATITPAGRGDVGSVNILEFPKGKEVVQIEYGNIDLTSNKWSPNSRYFVIVGYDKTVRVVDIQEGREVLHLTCDKLVRDVDWSPDSQHIVVPDGNSARILSISSGQEVARTDHDKTVFHVVWSPDGKYVASASAGPLSVVKVLRFQN